MKREVLGFLEQLKEHNDRQWFQENKSRYETARLEVEQLVHSIIPGISKFDPEIRYTEAKDCMFRIYRDVRFSKDKSPYKTNMGAWITPAGRKSFGPGYYIHIQPGESFLAAGVYMPTPEALKKIRNEVYYNFGEFTAILEEKKVKKYFQGLSEMDKAKMAPKDFPKDFQGIEWLKHRHYILSCPLSEATIESNGLTGWILDVFEGVQPFQHFLRRALEG